MVKILHIIDASNQGYRGSFNNRRFIYGTEFDGKVYNPVSVPVGAFSTIVNYATTMEAKHFGNPEVENHYVYCFDSRSKTIKKQMHPEYKSNRHYDPKSAIHEQFEYAEEVLRFYNYPVLRVEGYEADDVAYTLWKTAHLDYDYVFLHSSDTDWSFMINKSTVQIALRKQDNGKYELTMISKDNYQEELKTPYNTMLLKKLIKSDSSDSIKGIGMRNLPAIQLAAKDFVTDAELGDIRMMRDLLIRTAKMTPTFPLEQAMDTLDILTPELLSNQDFAACLLDYRPKHMPESYLYSIKPQTKQNEHYDMFYEFVEKVRTIR